MRPQGGQFVLGLWAILLRHPAATPPNPYYIITSHLIDVTRGSYLYDRTSIGAGSGGGMFARECMLPRTFRACLVVPGRRLTPRSLMVRVALPAVGLLQELELVRGHRSRRTAQVGDVVRSTRTHPRYRQLAVAGHRTSGLARQGTWLLGVVSYFPTRRQPRGRRRRKGLGAFRGMPPPRRVPLTVPRPGIHRPPGPWATGPASLHGP